MTTIENTRKLIDFTAKNFEQGKLDNNSLVQLIALCEDYLNLLSITEYCKKYNMSYNGVKNHREIIIILGKKFVIDNN